MGTYIDNYGYLHADKDSISYNCILYTVEFYLLKNSIVKLSVREEVELLNLIDLLYNNGKWKFYPDTTNDHMSHDNMTAIVCVAKKFGFKSILSRVPVIDWSFQRWHPRDVIFYGYCKYSGIKQLFFKLMMWVVSICMIVSCIQTYKIRNGQKIIKTDGKLLAWTRFNSIRMPITRYICTKILSFNSIFVNWDNVFKLYFTNTDHPISLELLNQQE